MHRPPEGVEGAQVTRLPSFKALLKELRSRNAAMTLHAASLERLLEGQATVRIAQREISAMPITHTWPGHHAARWGPFLLQGSWTSTAHFLQADAEERPPSVVPSGGQDRSGQLAEGETRSQRRWLPWRFARPGTSAAAEAQGPSPSAHTGVLFGRPLAALCSQEGALPQPIQDLLALLHEQGPSTEGIFRLAASERASRDIREALDTGAQVHLASQPVHVLAVILKDFLRKIPSKLLHSELYQQWMDALQKTSRQERLAGLKEVAGKLPEANLLLLRTLLSLLHKISTNVPVTKMTARNLAICVGPNLLSPPEEDTLALDVLMQVTGKVRCVCQPAAAFPAHASFALQGFLAAFSLQQMLVGELLRRAAPQLQLSVQKARSGVGRAVAPVCSQRVGNQWFTVCRCRSWLSSSSNTMRNSLRSRRRRRLSFQVHRPRLNLPANRRRSHRHQKKKEKLPRYVRSTQSVRECLPTQKVGLPL
ncbi:bargin-like [Columba livia]|uniref:bargin-like n=1 Tax=Columba livia TaxID=8932 RepID=UPI0031BB9466